MPGSVLDLDLPETTDTWPVWATKTRDCLQAIADDIEPLIATGAIEENADHSFHGYAVEDAKWYTVRAGSSEDIPTAGIGTKDGEWWVTDESGNQIQLTAGGAINIAGTGGFGGDYTTASAVAYYDDANERYTFYAGGGTDLAGLRGRSIQIGNNAADTNTVTIDNVAGTADWTITLPPAAPAATSALLMEADGDMTVGSIQVSTGAAASTAEWAHPVRSWTSRASAAHIATPAGAAPTVNSGGALSRGVGAWTSYYEVEPKTAGSRLTAALVKISKGDTSTTTLNVYKASATGALGAPIASGTVASSGVQEITFSVAPVALVEGENFIYEVIFTASTNVVYHVVAVFDKL